MPTVEQDWGCETTHCTREMIMEVVRCVVLNPTCPVSSVFLALMSKSRQWGWSTFFLIEMAEAVVAYRKGEPSQFEEPFRQLGIEKV
jgi:hypothetical protein